MVVPMLGIVYWDQPGVSLPQMPDNLDVALSTVTLAGVMPGQIGFGIAADIWGRRKVYGLKLIILLFATVSVATASSGVESSMSVVGLLLFWRFILGIGLGGGYPLSAVICSE
jgi:MFS transporter, PHS family, inorganic phosphate transporter